jgi:hypothetical protein
LNSYIHAERRLPQIFKKNHLTACAGIHISFNNKKRKYHLWVGRGRDICLSTSLFFQNKEDK